MADNQFKEGDVVVLKSGRQISPVMVIKKVDQSECICIWYNSGGNRFDEQSLPASVLMPLHN